MAQATACGLRGALWVKPSAAVLHRLVPTSARLQSAPERARPALLAASASLCAAGTQGPARGSPPFPESDSVPHSTGRLAQATSCPHLGRDPGSPACRALTPDLP